MKPREKPIFMRILVVSNLYPPHYIGGYELACRDAVEALKARGHAVEVLASTYKVTAPTTENGVHRRLKSDIELQLQGVTPSHTDLMNMEQHNQKLFRQVCRDFQPDVVFLWNIARISLSLIYFAQQLKIPYCCYVFDDWTAHWETDRWYQTHNYNLRRRLGAVRRGVVRLRLHFKGLRLPPDFVDMKDFIYSTKFLKQSALKAGKPVRDNAVIYWGIDSDKYPFVSAKQKPLRLLFSGQVVKDKGVHTAIEALRVLHEQFGLTDTTLTIAGGSVFTKEEASFRQLTAAYHLENFVRFTGMLSREDLKQVYQNHDILIFPSIWDEPFGITILEAMASGLAVVGTGTGGSGEIMKDGVNALLFPKEDAHACASQLARLIEDNSLYEQIRRQGRLSVEERFEFDRTVGQLEDILQRVRQHKRRRQLQPMRTQNSNQ